MEATSELQSPEIGSSRAHLRWLRAQADLQGPGGAPPTSFGQSNFQALPLQMWSAGYWDKPIQRSRGTRFNSNYCEVIAITKETETKKRWDNNIDPNPPDFVPTHKLLSLGKLNMARLDPLLTCCTSFPSSYTVG